MAAGAGAGGAVSDLARLLARAGDDVLQASGRVLARNEKHVRESGDAADRSKVLARIEAELHEAHVGRKGERGHEDRVAVRACASSDVLGADVSARAGPQLHDDVLAQDL